MAESLIVIHVDGVPVYEYPTINSKIIGTIPYYTPFTGSDVPYGPPYKMYGVCLSTTVGYVQASFGLIKSIHHEENEMSAMLCPMLWRIEPPVERSVTVVRLGPKAKQPNRLVRTYLKFREWWDDLP